jgi:hypothetical protein
MGFCLIQQECVCPNFMLEHFARTGIVTETAIRAAVGQGRARIQRDGILGADLQTSLATALSVPHPLTKIGGGAGIVCLTQSHIQ